MLELVDGVEKYVRESGSIRVSVIQRKFRVGYCVAARIKDALVERGVIADEFDVQLNGYPLRSAQLLHADGTAASSAKEDDTDVDQN